jgi:hypothetical protein
LWRKNAKLCGVSGFANTLSILKEFKEALINVNKALELSSQSRRFDLKKIY